MLNPKAQNNETITLPIKNYYFIVPKKVLRILATFIFDDQGAVDQEKKVCGTFNNPATKKTT